MNNVQYFVDGDNVRLVLRDETDQIVGSVCFTEDYQGPERIEYEAWLAEGNTPEQWNPNAD